MGNIFQSAFTKSQLLKNTTQALVAGDVVRIGEYNVQAGEKISMGYGAQSGMDNAVGRIYVDLKDTTGTPVAIDGLIRFSVWSPQNRLIKILREYRTEELRTSATDRTKQMPLPEDVYEMPEDRKFVLEIIPDAAQTLSKANSTIVVSMTVEEA